MSGLFRVIRALRQVGGCRVSMRSRRVFSRVCATSFSVEFSIRGWMVTLVAGQADENWCGSVDGDFGRLYYFHCGLQSKQWPGISGYQVFIS